MSGSSLGQSVLLMPEIREWPECFEMTERQEEETQITTIYNQGMQIISECTICQNLQLMG